MLLIITAGAVLRFAYLENVPGWWPDEGVMLNITANIMKGKTQMFAFTYPMNPHPPIFFLVAAPWLKVFGISILSLRTLSALFGCILILVIFLIGRKLKNPFAGLLAASLTAATPQIILTSRLALSYELLSLLYALTLFLLIIWEEKRHDFYLVLASLSAGFCATTSYAGAVAVVFVVIFILTKNYKKLPLGIIYAILPIVTYVAIMLFLDKKAFIHDLVYLFSRPEVNQGSKLVFDSYKKLVFAFPILVMGTFGFIFGKRKLNILTFVFILLVSLSEFGTRGYWWYMLTFLPLLTLGTALLLAEGLSRSYFFKTVSLICFSAIFIFLLSASANFILVKKNFGLQEERIFSPHNFAELKQAIDLINSKVSSQDTVLSSPHLSWMIKARPTDPVLSFISHDQATTNFPADMGKTGRFVYDPDYRKAKFYLEDKFMREWFQNQPGIKQGVIEPIITSWIKVFDAPEFKVYLNPATNE